METGTLRADEAVGTEPFKNTDVGGVPAVASDIEAGFIDLGVRLEDSDVAGFSDDGCGILISVWL